MSASPAFIRRTRNPDAPRPDKVIRTPKKPGEFELVRGQLVEVARG